MTKTLRSLKEKALTCKEKVMHVLANNVEAREDNLVLQFKTWEEEGLVLTDEQWAVVKCGMLSQPETIRRTRAKLQNEEGYYVAKKRRYKSQNKPGFGLN
jgi:hydroxymethylpyrimidine/phosphomethylpyrimidine kinase